jgi:hypothetical protein
MLLHQYDAFWSSLARISRLPAAQRRAALAVYTIEPELTSFLNGLVKLDAKGEVLYGRNLPRPTARLSANGLTAVVNDCQDSSHAGTANSKTLAPLNVGTLRNHVVATMKLAAGQPWKIAFVAYTKTPC